MADRVLYSFIFLTSVSFCSYISGFDLVLLHTNDVHARFEETDEFGGPCLEETPCYGGVARRATLIKQYREQHDNVLLLDGGDQFQGTLWFNYYAGNATSYFMNELGYDVMGLGNHEFDNGVDGLIPFLEDVTFDTLACNIDVSDHEDSDLLSTLIQSSVVKDFPGDVRVGLIGFITEETPTLVNPDGVIGLTFHPEIESIQAEVDKLKSLDPPVNIIIAVGHSGYNIDLEIAAQVTDLDVIVGGHTDTFLYTGNPLPSSEEPQGPYPTFVDGPSGWPVPVVQAYTVGKYLGVLHLTFDDDGNLLAQEGNPVLIDEDIEMDPAIAADVDIWKIPIEAIQEEYVGYSHVFLDGSRETCRMTECNLGNLIADGVIYRASLVDDIPLPEDAWIAASVAMWNSGGIRSSILQGNITMNSVFQVLPFTNVMDFIVIPGATLVEALEHGVTNYIPEDPFGGFLQVSGLIVTYDINMTEGNRVLSVQVLCHLCDVPVYEDLDMEKHYPIITSDFVLNGGDGFDMFEDYQHTRIPTGIVASEALEDQLRHLSPIIQGLENRIVFENSDITDSSSDMNKSMFFLVLITNCLIFTFQ